MKIATTLRNRLLAAAAFGLLLTALSVPAHAASKEMIELQTQVQQLLDMVQRLQSTLDTRMGVMQHMVEQTNEATTQMASTVNALQLKINAQTEANNGKLDTVSGQVQSLNDSVDELKSRIAKLDKTVQDMQAQMQAMQAPPSGAAPAGQAGQPSQPGQPGDPNAPQGAGPAAPPAPVAPPLKDTYQAGLRDYNAAHYDVASSEFQDVLHYYPNDDLAGTAQFYLGEIAYHQQNYADAVKDYNAVIEGFPGSSKAPAAQLRKGLSLIELGKRDTGIHELRSLIQRHPQTPEASQARSKLNALGVRVNAQTR
jgi:tol-pal system protein YbgF